MDASLRREKAQICLENIERTFLDYYEATGEAHPWVSRMGQRVVKLIHDDGSVFIFDGADVVWLTEKSWTDGWVGVITEHHGLHLLSTEDIKSLRTYEATDGNWPHLADLTGDGLKKLKERSRDVISSGT